MILSRATEFFPVTGSPREHIFVFVSSWVPVFVLVFAPPHHNANRLNNVSKQHDLLSPLN